MYPFITGITGITGLLLVLLSAAAWHDVRTYRIPNRLVFAGTIIAVVFNTVAPAEIGGLGVLDSIAGLAVGLVALLPLYLLRVMGAGDVKLMAMTGAFLGAEGASAALMCVLLSGGVLALGVALYQGNLLKLLQKLKVMVYITCAYGSMPGSSVKEGLSGHATESIGKLPYGVAIAVGTAIYLAISRWG
jgi:prepilin peptidase CpaA